MATTNFKYQVEQFLRLMSNEERTIDLTNPLNTTGVNAPSIRHSVQSIYDYFHNSGLALFRVLKKLTAEDLYRLDFYISEVVTIGSGVGTITLKFDQILDDALVTISGAKVSARRYSPSDALAYSTTTGKRKSPSLESPKFEIKKISNVTKVAVYPTTGITDIELRGLAVVERLTLSNSLSDIWSANFNDILTQGAVMLAKGDANQVDLAQYFAQELNFKYSLYSKQQMKSNNSLIEENK